MILKSLVDAGVTVRSFTTTKISLEDIFIRVYGDQNTPAASGTAGSAGHARFPARDGA